MSKKLTILFVVLALCAPAQSEGPINVVNPSFESGTTGWSGATSDNSEYYAAPDGTGYATRSGGAGYTSQMTGHTITAGDTYTLTVWARSINAAANSAATNAEVRFYYGSSTITAVTQDVYPVRLSGAPATIHNDDGGNVWLDGNYRMSCAIHNFYQTIDKDPINDPWSDAGEPGDDCGLAPIMTPEGLNAIYGCACYTEDPIYSWQKFTTFTGDPPFYDYSGAGDPILEHTGDEDPWCIDSHLYYDYDTSRLWMTWGGGVAYVSELDPYDGELIDHPSDPEFDTHPSWYHTQVNFWGGDEWSSGWMEGPSLYKHNGYWYLFPTCGNMNADYTIRMGRGFSPTGPFYDKDGVGLMEYDVDEDEYGNSIMLGDEGEYLVPGHPHLWEENGTYYMGYDYRPNDVAIPDLMGIRHLYWVNDWPTIWTPITVTFNADDHPDAIGQTLGISLRNTGSGSNAAFDHVSLTHSGGAPDTDPPTPDPATWASVPSDTGGSSVTMTATTATDISGVEYYFDETTGGPGGTDSTWLDSPSYTDGLLDVDTEYCYQVKARDKSPNQNETAWSTTECATPTLSGWIKVDDMDPSISYTGTWESGGCPWAYMQTLHSSIEGGTTASLTFDSLQIRLYAGTQQWGGNGDIYIDDEYQTTVSFYSPTSIGDVLLYENGDLSSGPHTIKVETVEEIYIDAFEYYIEGEPDTDPPSPDPMTWASVPSADSDTAISMTATTATDPAGVSYYFDETSGNPGGSDSGWKSGPSYTDSGLNPETQYTYTVTARDNSSNHNETAASTAESATTHAGPVLTDNFESSTDWSNNWTAYGAWQRVTAKPYDGSYSAEIDGGVTDSALVSVAIDVAGKTDATFTFAWLIESGLDSGEYLRFDVDTGSGWVQKASLDGNVDTEDVWHNESIPVDVSAASTMSFRFRGNMSGSNEDAYVDVVEVRTFVVVPDTDQPTPDPATWATAPYATGKTSIDMTATTASDPSGVEYYFDETTGGGNDSAWQDDTYYQDNGLNAGTQYCYEVTARDKSANQNETAVSSNQCATTDADETTPPEPDPMTWATVPYAIGSSSIAMVATTATDASGVEYYFDETTGNPGGDDSGWQNSQSYQDSDLSPETMYTYTVTARDKSANHNETAASTAESETTGSFTPCTGGIYTDYIGAGQDDDVVATGSKNESQASPQDTVNGSGLVGDAHSVEWDDGWLHFEQPPVPVPSPNPARGDGFWIHYDLGYLYTLTDTWVWNSNEACCTNRGFNDVVIDYSDDGSTWTELGNFQWPQASGSSDYTGFAGPNFGSICARYILITANSNWGSPGGYGLAEIKFSIGSGGPCTPTDMHIESVVCAEVDCGRGKDNGQATVTIYDDCGDPVANALVDGTFSGDFNESFYDVATDGNGVAVFTTAGCIKKPTFSFTVDDVDHGTLPHDPGDDLATGCSG